MKSFTDADGRQWCIELTVNAVKRLRGLLSVDLFKLADDGFQDLADMVSDPCQLADMLFVLVKDQADRLGVSDQDFGRALAGDVIAVAAEAFVGELVEFFPEPPPGTADGVGQPRQKRTPPTCESLEGVVWQLAGQAGVDPGPLTLRQLALMAEARGRQEWNQTSLLAALLHNLRVALTGGTAKVPNEFSPYGATRGRTEEPDIRLSGKDGMALLKRAYG